MTHPARVDGYLPIQQYGVIGDCRSVSLVGCDGSIDWMCLPRFDDSSIFGRLLDARRAGYWQIQPRAPYTVVQRYRDRSNILETVFTTRTGKVVVTDFMPVDERSIRKAARPHTEARVVRIVECLAGEVTLRHDLRPAPDYARSGCPFEASDGMYHGDSSGLHLCIRSTRPFDGPQSDVHLARGEVVAFGLISSRAGVCPKRTWTLERARALLTSTREYWWDWIGRCRYTGPFQEPVWRSALALKLMTYAPTGAIVAAPTTSLPEHIGGDRNWDYRFTWLRDASFTLFAFFQLGFTEEAHAFFDWLTRIGVGDHGSRLQNLYDMDGRVTGREQELSHLDGYRGSQPVRIGNGAAEQLQLDVYGEVLDSAYVYARFGGHISRTLWEDLHAIVEMAISNWQLTDASIWEVRGPNQHFTYSKLMCWVAVDRGLRLAERYQLAHDGVRWRRARGAIRRRILAEAWSERRGAFTQAFDSDVIDAAMLRMSQTRFLPDRDPRLRRTIRAVERTLAEGPLVRRYRTEQQDDGVGGPEGAFLMCSFWLADALAHIGELDRAQRLFDRLLTFGSPLGLFAEEADTRTGVLLGNFPQAFTHLSLVGAAVNIERARHRQLSPHGLRQPRSHAASDAHAAAAPTNESHPGDARRAAAGRHTGAGRAGGRHPR